MVRRRLAALQGNYHTTDNSVRYMTNDHMYESLVKKAVKDFIRQICWMERGFKDLRRVHHKTKASPPSVPNLI